MNRPLFRPEHLRIAAEVRTKASRQRWLDLAGVLLVVLIMTAGGLGALLPFFMLAQLTTLLLGR